MTQAERKLDGQWKLVYTSNSELFGLLALSRLPFVTVGDITQTVQASTLTVENKVAPHASHLPGQSAHITWPPCHPQDRGHHSRGAGSAGFCPCCVHAEEHLIHRRLAACNLVSGSLQSHIIATHRLLMLCWYTYRCS